MKKNLQSIIVSIVLIFLLIVILNYPNNVIESVTFSISIWKDNLFPSLFPFLILNYILLNYGVSLLFSELVKPFVVNILHLPSSCGFTLVSSVFSGFPSSAKFIKNQLDKKEITLDEANYLLSFCHFSSPLFVIGTIGLLLLGDKKLGILILVSHYIGAFLIALIFRKRKKQKKESINLRYVFQEINQKIKESESFANVLKSSITNALDILFMLLGIVTIFLIITNLAVKIIPLTVYQKALLSGILEMTQGVKNASILKTTILNRCLLMVSFVSFGGLSVHTQVFSILSEYKVSYLKFLISRIMHVVLSNITFVFLFFLLNTMF